MQKRLNVPYQDSDRAMQKRRKFGYVFQKDLAPQLSEGQCCDHRHGRHGPAFAAEDTAEENCFQTLNIPRATGSTVDKSVLLDESRLYLITDFGAVSEGDPVQNTKAINAAIQAASEAGR